MTLSVISVIQPQDLREIARIHLAAFPKSALGQLGEEIVTRYYRWQLQGPHDAVAIGVYCKENLAGFCFGGVFRGALSGFLQRNRNFLVLHILLRPWLIANPLFFERLHLARSVLMGRPASPISSIALPEKSFGILSIAVDPKMQGAGYGKMLMLEIEMIAREKKFSNMHLTVSIDNGQAIRFYEKLGWQKLLASDGTWHGSMTKKLETLDK